MLENPNLPEATALKLWYEKRDTQVCYKPMISDKTIELVRIIEISKVPLTTSISVAAIIYNVDDIKSYIKRSTGKEIKRREITLVDTSEEAIILTLWNNDAENFNSVKGDVLLITNAAINEYQSRKSISKLRETTILSNPEIQEKNQLESWFNDGGKEAMHHKIINMALA